MNPETRMFEQMPDPIPEEKKDWPRFSVGQPVEIGGVQFRIRKITNKDLVLRPVK